MPLAFAEPLRFFGLLPQEVVAQTPAFPAGEVDGAPFARWPVGTTKFELCPGDKVLVSGTVLSRFLDADDPTPVNQQNARWTRMLPAKLYVKSVCGPLNGTIIDSDRQIVVSGNACIEVLTPSTWATERPVETENRLEIAVWVTACPVRCCYPPLPHLTYWRRFIAPMTGIELRTFIVPRGARRFTAYKASTSPPGITTIEYWMGAAGTNLLLGSEGVASTVNSTVDPFGAADEIAFSPTNTDVGQLQMRWEVEG